MSISDLLYNFRESTVDENEDEPPQPPKLKRAYACRECACGNTFSKTYDMNECDDCIIRHLLRKRIRVIRRRKVIKTFVEQYMPSGLGTKIAKFI